MDLKSLPKHFKKDREIVLVAVKQYGSAIQYADEEFRKDNEIVLEAVKKDGYALEYVDDSFKKNKEIVLIAVKCEGSAIQFADDSFKKDQEIVNSIVQGDIIENIQIIGELPEDDSIEELINSWNSILEK